MQTKVCTKCGEEKELNADNFIQDRSRPSGFYPTCKVCVKASRAARMKDPRYRKKIYRQQKAYIAANVERVSARKKEYAKEYRRKNKDILREKSYQWARENPDKVREIQRRSNKKRLKKTSAWVMERYHGSPELKFIHTQRGRISASIRARGQGKTETSKELLGVPMKDCIEHIASLFQEGMSWGNYGRDDRPGDRKWHVHHLIPVLARIDETEVFDLSREEDRKIAFNYLNLAPVWGLDNWKQSNNPPHWDELPPELQAICTPRIKALLRKVEIYA